MKRKRLKANDKKQSTLQKDCECTAKITNLLKVQQKKPNTCKIGGKHAKYRKSTYTWLQQFVQDP